MAKIIIPTPLRKFTDNEKAFVAQPGTVDSALAQLTNTYPTLKNQLLDDSGTLRSFIKVFVGDDDIKDLQQGETAVTDSSVISIIPAIAGGSI